MAYARKRGKYWSARWREGNRDAEEGGFLDKASAISHAKDQEYLVRKGLKTRPSEMNLTVKEFVEQIWYPTLRVEEGTLQDYEYSLNGSVIPRFGDVRMKDIKPADIESWVADMHKNLAETVVAKRRLLLASILKKAVQNDYLIKNPFATLKFPKPKKINKVRPLTYEQVNRIAMRISPRYRLFVWIGYYTGMRANEILGLTWEQLDFELGTIHIDRQLSLKSNEIHRKSGLKTEAADRTIGFAKDLQILIREQVETYGLGPEGLVMSTVGGKVFRYKGAIEMFREAARAEGILNTYEGIHQLRHTCVSILINEGANPKQIQVWVGHTSIDETMNTYGHLFPNAKHELSSMLDNYANRHKDQTPLEIAN
jgi:integrase